MVGHTHDDIDQSFSVIARHLAKTEAHSLESFCAAVRESYSGRPDPRRVDYQRPQPSVLYAVHDWKGFLEPFIDPCFR
jgi:hypothetical protein